MDEMAMNLIEELGGYENAKEGFKRENVLSDSDLADSQAKLLEYRRPNNLYGLGDLVVRKSKTTLPTIWKILGESNVFKDAVVCRSNDPLIYHLHLGEIRHATDDEIKAEKRL